jgi:hypothetical protein
MKNTMIVVTNLGSFKAYRFDGDDPSSSPSLRQLETPDSPNEHNKRGNTLTVMEGKSSSKPGNESMTAIASDGEQHNMELEKRRRAIKQIGQNVKSLTNGESDLKLLIAAPKEILNQVMDTLEPGIKNRVQKALPLDLTHAKKAELLHHFYPDGVRKS